MNRNILYLALLFLISSGFAQAQRPTPSGGCTQAPTECYEFSYFGATEIEAGLMQLSFGLQVNCDKLAYIAFELPDGSEAAGPADVYHQNARTYVVRNGITSEQGPNEVETPFNAIQFNAKQNYSLTGGAVDTFTFNLTQADFEALGTMRVRATLRSGVVSARDQVTQSRQVVFDLSACSPSSPGACVIERDQASFAFAGATDNGDGTTTVLLQVENKSASDVNRISIETVETADALAVEGMTNGNVYHTTNFGYKVSIDQDANLITFDAQNNKGYSNGAADVFAVVVPRDLYELEPYFTITMTAGNVTESVGLNTISCEDIPITPLPVELASFEGKATQSGIELEWSTASEENNDRFEVERSQDGRHFSKIAEAKGAGNSITPLYYSYTDRTAADRLYYYRLKQVDFDGASEFSKVVAVRSIGLADATMEVYPNPVPDNYLKIAMQNEADAQLKIMDRNGRTVYTQRIGAGRQELQLSVSELNVPKGLYYVHLQGTNVSRQVQKLIIQ
ncbi:T9SS type A sorting domain-containing protein [Pontibacter mangrovi]|uniref:T9SS type A sorting domain-containing protein n=1 Tax=Pontibacter mangrovi TaxID=2589816 RepID=A0A501W8K3_9BACT|nr:T9SS type A sorting domain-containing protein [Pontibacter mangrovi]TPE44700.1 T9SS type A sorting domain-containing protein [Pontibacter mangrovi]